MPDLQIIFENSKFLAVDKPAGVIVNRADTSKNFITLQDMIEQRYKISETPRVEDEAFIIDGYNKFDEFVSRSGIVHRLDKETSGIILVAKDPQTFLELQNQFKESLVKKKYIALVHGYVSDTEGEIDVPVARLPWNRKRFGVHPEGREAKTQYKVLEIIKSKHENYSLLEVSPLTGRTHQIRVHFQHIHHPIFADELYAGRKTARDERKILSRHFLHAFQISFIDPETKNPIVLESPLPQDLTNTIAILKKVD